MKPRNQSAEHLLRLLAQEDASATRDGVKIIVRRVKKGVSLASGAAFSADALAALVSSGAVRCETRAGVARYLITKEGVSQVRRLDAKSDTPFADQHRQIEMRSNSDEGGQLRVNLRADPLALLARMKDGHGVALAGPAAIGAGERLRRDIMAAQIPPKTTSNWDRLVVDGAGPGNGLTLSERALAARTRVESALKAVGPDFAGLLFDLCGFSRGIEEIEAQHGLPQRSGKVALAFALRALARHYGLSELATGQASTLIQSWGAADYRPALKRA